MEDFGRWVDDPEEGPLYYVFIADVEIKSQPFEIDRGTGLMSLRRFLKASQKLLQGMMNSPVTRLNNDHFGVLTQEKIFRSVWKKPEQRLRT